MKNIPLIAMAFVAASSLSMAAELLPAGHFNCINRGSDETCSAGQSFYYTEGDDGRCGCVATHEIIPMSQCKRTTITCKEPGEKFATLVTFENLCGMLVEQPTGCGCFSTFDGVIPF